MGYPGNNCPIGGRNRAAPGPSALIQGRILAAPNTSSSSLPRFADWVLWNRWQASGLGGGRRRGRLDGQRLRGDGQRLEIGVGDGYKRRTTGNCAGPATVCRLCE